MKMKKQEDDQAESVKKLAEVTVKKESKALEKTIKK
jgi:hypothetical protein